MLFKKAPGNDDGASLKQGYGRSLFLSSSKAPVNGVDLSLPFKDKAGPLKLLTPRLAIVSHPERGALFIDGRRIADVSGTLQLSPWNSEHSLIWRAENGFIVWKQIVAALPFETKRICIKER